MNQKIRVIKRKERQQSGIDRPEESTSHPTREITTTIKLWITEFKQRRPQPRHGFLPATLPISFVLHLEPER